MFLKRHDIILSHTHSLVGKRKRHSLAENNHTAHVTKLMRIHEKSNTRLKNKPESDVKKQKQEHKEKTGNKDRVKENTDLRTS